MPTTVDIVFCVDYTSSMTSYFDKVLALIIFIFKMLLGMQANVCIGLIKFRSMYDGWNTKVHGFTQDLNELQQWIITDQPGGICPDGYEAVGDALNGALNLQWRSNDNQVRHKKIVILFTDGAPNGLFTPLVGTDPWVISNEFLKQNITLLVVGVGESIVVCDDFYCALAKNTGGAYIPLVNFERIFSQVIDVVSSESEGGTVHQALMHLNIEELEQNSSFKYKYMEHRVNDMINECESIGDIRNKFYKYK